MTCLRCRKTGADCVFSPAGAAWRRAAANTALRDSTSQGHISLPQHQQTLLGDDSNLLDISLAWPWPPLLDASIPPPGLDHLQQSSSVPLPNSTTPSTSPRATADNAPETIVAQESPRTTCVRQLSNLAFEVDQVSAELSPMAVIHLARGGNVEELCSKHVIRVPYSRCIEQLFILTQRLIDLYPETLELMLGEDLPHEPEDCPDPECVHNSDIPEELADIFLEAGPRPGKVDVFLFHLLTACHEKVSGVLDRIAMSAKLCAKVCMTSPGLIQPKLHIPELRVGKFVASPTSSSSMQVALFAHVTSVLLENAKVMRKTLEGALTAEAAASPVDKQTQIILVQCELIEERNKLHAEQFMRISDNVTKLNMLHVKKG